VNVGSLLTLKVLDAVVVATLAAAIRAATRSRTDAKARWPCAPCSNVWRPLGLVCVVDLDDAPRQIGIPRDARHAADLFHAVERCFREPASPRQTVLGMNCPFGERWPVSSFRPREQHKFRPHVPARLHQSGFWPPRSRVTSSWPKRGFACCFTSSLLISGATRNGKA